MQKKMYFIAGLPRSGSTLLSTILNQNPLIYSNAVSSLPWLLNNVNTNWNSCEANLENYDLECKKNVLKSIITGYYSQITKPIIIDKDRMWINLIDLMECLLDQKVKMIITVRKPVDIIASFEKIVRDNPLYLTGPEQQLNIRNNISNRANIYADPTGPLGRAHIVLQDMLVKGYADRLLFIDYDKLCNDPKKQMARLYDFLNLEVFDHNFQNIEQNVVYNSDILNLPNLHSVKNKLEKTRYDAKTMLGGTVYNEFVNENMNDHIFWNVLT